MLKEVNDSKFNMWRAIIALIHIDGVIHAKEVELLKQSFQKIPFSESQRKILIDDIQTPKAVDSFYNAISVPSDRSHFIYFARLLLWSDGVFHEQEKAILSRLNQSAINMVDLNAAMHSVDSIASEYASKNAKTDLRTLITDFVDRFFS